MAAFDDNTQAYLTPYPYCFYKDEYVFGGSLNDYI